MKPEKKIMKFYSIPPTGLEETFQEGEIEGWNDHYDAVEKWLPSDKEIDKIVFNIVCRENPLNYQVGDKTIYRLFSNKIAKAISKRLEIK